jgi:copper chaperone CopZ
MKHSVPYLHVLDGRIRIKIPEVKRSPLKADEIEQTLRNIDGITDVKANPMTGNVLILFDSNTISSQQIMAKLKQLCRLENQSDSSPSAQGSEPQIAAQITESFLSKATEVLVSKAAELAVERLLFALA